MQKAKVAEKRKERKKACKKLKLPNFDFWDIAYDGGINVENQSDLPPSEIHAPMPHFAPYPSSRNASPSRIHKAVFMDLHPSSKISLSAPSSIASTSILLGARLGGPIPLTFPA